MSNTSRLEEIASGSETVLQASSRRDFLVSSATGLIGGALLLGRNEAAYASPTLPEDLKRPLPFSRVTHALAPRINSTTIGSLARHAQPKHRYRNPARYTPDIKEHQLTVARHRKAIDERMKRLSAPNRPDGKLLGDIKTELSLLNRESDYAQNQIAELGAEMQDLAQVLHQIQAKLDVTKYVKPQNSLVYRNGLSLFLTPLRQGLWDVHIFFAGGTPEPLPAERRIDFITTYLMLLAADDLLKNFDQALKIERTKQFPEVYYEQKLKEIPSRVSRLILPATTTAPTTVTATPASEPADVRQAFTQNLQTEGGSFTTSYQPEVEHDDEQGGMGRAEYTATDAENGPMTNPMPAGFVKYAIKNGYLPGDFNIGKVPAQ